MNKRITHNQLFQLTMANIRELVREPGVLFWGIVFPILMSLGLGVAFTQKKDVTTTIAVVGGHHLLLQPGAGPSSINRFLIGHKAGLHWTQEGDMERHLSLPDDKLGNTLFVFRAMEWERAMVMLKRGKLNLVMEEDSGTVKYHFDPANPEAQLVYLKLSKLLAGGRLAGPDNNSEVQTLTVTGTRYIDFLVPGLIGMGVMMSCMWGVSYAIIERRSKKLLRRMVATPMRRSNFLVALIAVRILMNFVEAALLMLVAGLVFGISVQGSMAALLTLFIAGNFAFAGIAVLLASHTARTEIGNGLINAVSMPMMVLSGIFFSYHNFPSWAVPVIKQFPLTMLADGLRSIMIEGAGFGEVYVPVAVLSLIGLLFFVTGLKFFRWH